MKTQMKSDALLDAFEKQQLNDDELGVIKGGDIYSWILQHESGNNYIIIATIHSNGSTTYMNIIGNQMTAQQIMGLDDHYFTP